MTRKEKIAAGLPKMPKRKKQMALDLRDAREDRIQVKLRNHRIAPRKMRLVADLIRGQEVFQALNILKFTPNSGAKPLSKLIKAAIASYEEKTGERVDVNTHYVSEVMVGESGTLKRIQPAPQGRAHIVRKRSCHTTLMIETYVEEEEYYGDDDQVESDTQINEDDSTEA